MGTLKEYVCVCVYEREGGGEGESKIPALRVQKIFF